MSSIVVFGASGQLGQCIREIAGKEGIKDIHFPPESEANILDSDLLRKVFDTYKPDYCINCAAYTAVDKAEEEQDLAHKVNKIGPEKLARFCAERKSVLIHISTDFVFKGDQSSPRKETDEADPISVYGRTKLDGELAITAKLKNYFIIRTGWLYSEYGNNFVKTMLKYGAERGALNVVADQAGTPTYAIDLAGLILDIIKNNRTEYGIYHYSNEGIASWYDFAKAIFEIHGMQVKVTPVRTDQYVTKAARPAYSVMDKSKIKDTFGLEIPYWRESLTACIKKLK